MMNTDQAMKKLGKNIRRMREELDMTQDRMRDLGFNYRYYQKIEAGEVNATLDTLVKLANVFKCRLPDLLQ